jgi:hypothetical protein
MRNSILGSLQLRLEAVRRKESALRGARKKGRDRVHRGKRPANHQEDNESTVQGENEENRSKSRRVENDNDGSRRERQEGERSHRSRQHRDKSWREESRHNLHDAKMKDLEDKYSRILRQMEGEHPKLTAWDMLEDESLPFTERVKAYPMPNKFKMPRIEKYDGSKDLQDHLEAF